MTTPYELRHRNGTILYIGIAENLRRRLSEHARDQEWWDLVEHVTIEQYESRRTAEIAERAAIFHERPLFNVIGGYQHKMAAGPGSSKAAASRRQAIEMLRSEGAGVRASVLRNC